MRPHAELNFEYLNRRFTLNPKPRQRIFMHVPFSRGEPTIFPANPILIRPPKKLFTARTPNSATLVFYVFQSVSPTSETQNLRNEIPRMLNAVAK